MFKVSEKYSRTTNFITRVIIPAQKELNSKAPFSFEYHINKQGKKFHTITFFPVNMPQNRNIEAEAKALIKQVNLSAYFDKTE